MRGAEPEIGYSLTTDSSNNIFIAGFVQQTQIYSYEMVMYKVNSLGDLI